MLNTAQWASTRRLGRLGRLAWGVVRMAPGQAALFVLLHLLAQAALLLALVLPWKLIAHAVGGAGDTLLGVTWPDHPLDWHDVALLVLAALTVYAGAEFMMGAVRRLGERRVQSRIDRLPIFDGKLKQFQLNYRQILYSLSRVVALGVLALALWRIYPGMLVAMVAYFVAGLVGLCLLAGEHRLARQDGRLAESGVMRNAWVGGGLLYAGIGVYLDFGRGQMPALGLALLGLLLLRVALGAAAQLVAGLRALVERVDRLEALLGEEGKATGSEAKAVALLSLAKPEHRLGWVRQALQGLIDPRAQLSVCACWMLTGGWALCATVRCTMTGQPDRVYLIKIFDVCAQERLFNELGLVLDAPPSWPVPRLLLRCAAQGHPGLVYGWSDNAVPVAKNERVVCLLAVREQLLSCRLPQVSQARYAKSRSQLAQRLQVIDWQAVAALLPRANDGDGEFLQACWAEVVALASVMPGQLVIPQLQFMRLDRVDDRLVVSNLSKWAWEPVGAGWPVGIDSHVWDAVLARARKVRSELGQVTVEQARLMAACHEFERLWRGRDFGGALEMVTPMADALRCLAGTQKNAPWPVADQGDEAGYKLVAPAPAQG